MAKGDFGPTALLRPMHFTVSIVEDEKGGWTANVSTGVVGEVVAPDGRTLAPGRNFEVDLTADEQAAANALVNRVCADVVASEGLAGLFDTAAAQAAAEAAAAEVDAAAGEPAAV